MSTAVIPYFRNEWLEAGWIEGNWILVRWVNNDVGYLSKNFIKTLKRLEKKIVDENLEGWFCESAKEHTEMHHIIEKFGCHFFLEEDGKFFFKKELKPCAADQSAVSPNR